MCTGRTKHIGWFAPSGLFPPGPGLCPLRLDPFEALPTRQLAIALLPPLGLDTSPSNIPGYTTPGLLPEARPPSGLAPLGTSPGIPLQACHPRGFTVRHACSLGPSSVRLLLQGLCLQASSPLLCPPGTFRIHRFALTVL
jgi:hypothetical protein